MSSAQPEARPVPTGTTESPAHEQAADYKGSSKLPDIPSKNNPAKIASGARQGTGLPELRPDYCISVNVSKGPQVDTDIANIKKLTNALVKSGLYVQVRQGTSGKLLVLVKCSRRRLEIKTKQSRVQDWLYEVREDNPADNYESSDDDQLTPAEKLRLIYGIISDPIEAGGAGITIGIAPWKFVDSIFPLHNHELNIQWVRRWSTKWLVGNDDIELIRIHFGEKLALYFAFLQFYFSWLLIPAIAGVVTANVFGGYSVVYAIINGIWGIVFIQAWKRRERALAIEWGVIGSEVLETRRSKFVPEKYITDVVSGVSIPYYPRWKRSVKQLASVPLALGAGVGLIAIQTLVFIIEIFISQIYNGPFKQYLTFLPTILLVAIVPQFISVYSRVVAHTNNWENHETEDSYEIAFTQKMFVLNFLTSFMGLFLTAYVYLPFGHLIIPHLDIIGSVASTLARRNIATADNFEINGLRLQQQVIYFMGTAQVVNFFMETVLPYAQRKLFTEAKKITYSKAETYNDDPEEAEILSQLRTQVEFPVYSVQEDYREMVVQYGYTALFSVVWPYAPLASLINNWFEQRGDALKICLDMKRPIPQRAESIGPWINDLVFLTWLGSITTASVVAMFGKSDLKSTLTGSAVKCAPWSILFTILASEHLYFGASTLVSFIFRSLSSKEDVKDKKHRFEQRKRYLDEKLQAEPIQNVIHTSELEPAEAEWRSVDEAELSNQVTVAVERTKASKVKKQ